MNPQGHPENPAALLEQTFAAILQQRMSGLPFLNPALHVEAVGFRRYGQDWLGILITPWFMNLMLLPGAANDWPAAAEGYRQVWRFPAGEIQFIAACEAGIGTYQQCPLFASMQPFADQIAARTAAGDALEALLTPPVPEPVAETEKDEVSQSKRSFLRGKFFGA